MTQMHRIEPAGDAMPVCCGSRDSMKMELRIQLTINARNEQRRLMYYNCAVYSRNDFADNRASESLFFGDFVDVALGVLGR